MSRRRCTSPSATAAATRRTRRRPRSCAASWRRPDCSRSRSSPSSGRSSRRSTRASKFDAYTVGWLPDYPDPDTFSQPLVGRDGSLHNGYSSKKVDDLIGATLEYSDRSRTSADYKELQAIVGEDVPLVPLWQKKDYVVSTIDVSGSQYLSDGTGIWRLWELRRL